MTARLNRTLSLARHIVSAIVTSAVVTCSFPTNAQVLGHGTVVLDEQQVIAQLQTLPEVELKDAYSHCSREATQRLLGYGEAALCSIVYETLLRRVFGGNFDALLTWSKVHFHDASEEAANDATFIGGVRALQR